MNVALDCFVSLSVRCFPFVADDFPILSKYFIVRPRFIVSRLQFAPLSERRGLDMYAMSYRELGYARKAEIEYPLRVPGPVGKLRFLRSGNITI